MKKNDPIFVHLKITHTKLEEVSLLDYPNNDILRDCLIFRFKLANNLIRMNLQTFLQDVGVTLENSFPRTIYKKAYVNNLLTDDLLWINLLEDRNATPHLYNESLATEIANRIATQYVQAIGELIENLEKLL
ncbi:MAG: HI0074 family nucleotidyltransferase substrate-binding subunit [Turicibacter sp.]